MPGYPVQRSHSWLNFQMKPVLRWTVFWFALVWLAHSTHCSRSTTCREIQLCDTLTLVPWIKHILRRYEQPSEFSEFPWHILRHIFLLLGIPIDRVPTSKSCIFCIGMDSFYATFDSFLVSSCWKDYFLETKVLCKYKGSEKSQFSDSIGFTNLLYKSLKCH